MDDKNQAGCRVLLNRSDILTIQYQEWAIFKLMMRKTTVTRPTIMQQFKELCDYLKKNYIRAENVEEMSPIIKNLHDNLISSYLPKNTWNYVNQLKLFATTQLAEQCIMKIEPEAYSGDLTIMTQSPPSSMRIWVLVIRLLRSVISILRKIETIPP